MRVPEFIALPAVEVVEFSDPTIANSGIELIEQDAVLLATTPLRVRRIVVRLHDIALIYHSANQRVRSCTSAREMRLAYVVFGSQVRGPVNGLPVRAGLMLAAAPGAQARFVTDSGWQSITLMVRPQQLRAQQLVRAGEGGGEFRLPNGIEALNIGEEQAAALFDWGKRLADTAARQPALFNDRPDLRAAAQADLLEALLTTLRGSRDVDTTRSERKRQAYSHMVMVVEGYALAHLADHPQVGDLCKVAAASERTLENAFKEILGVTPAAYLIRLRLHRVRQALLAGSPGSTTVSAEALDWGLWHFGEFSRAYKACFDELPSDTLRRPASAASTAA